MGGRAPFRYLAGMPRFGLGRAVRGFHLFIYAPKEGVFDFCGQQLLQLQFSRVGFLSTK
jgi:hypothetical protein